MRRERFNKALDCDFPVDAHARDVQGVERLFAAVAPDFPTVTWIRVDTLMCDRTHCATELDGVPLYFDESHLNDMASRLLARKWLASHGNPLLGDASPACPDSTGNRTCARASDKKEMQVATPAPSMAR